MLRYFIAGLALIACATGWAQSVTLQGMLGGKALLIVDGSAPKAVAAGQTHRGVTVLSTSSDEAVVEIAGQRRTLRLGEAPGNVGGTGDAPAHGSRIVMTAQSGGHFFSAGAINGKPVRFLVDTGATSISIGVPEAERIGLNYKTGERARSSTANGPVTTWKVRLSSVRVGDVEVHDVDASVLPAAMPFVLLGNSFLSRFQMKRENDLMVLERRY